MDINFESSLDQRKKLKKFEQMRNKKVEEMEKKKIE